MKIDPKVKKVIEEFPTSTKRMLDKKSYFWVVYSRLVGSSSFLEIGYRKGIFTEICKALEIPSVHIDISDEMLKALPTDNNQCITIDSISYLKKCSRKFDLIFQDGSKEYKDRVKEYDLIMSNSILLKGGTIIVDDLHYQGSKDAFKYAYERYNFGWVTTKVKDKKTYEMGILSYL